MRSNAWRFIVLAALLAAGPALAKPTGARVSQPSVADPDVAQRSDASVAAPQAAIQDVWDRYTATVNAGDLDGWMALWAPGGVRMPPGAPMSIGLEAIRTSMVAPLTQYDDEIHINVMETMVAGDWAFSRGTYTLLSVPKIGRRAEAGGAGTQVDGKFTTILQRQPDGTWKIYRDIFNSNVPAM